MHISCHEMQNDIWSHTDTVHVKTCSLVIRIKIQCCFAEVQCLLHAAYTTLNKSTCLPSEIPFPVTSDAQMFDNKILPRGF